VIAPRSALRSGEVLLVNYFSFFAILTNFLVALGNTSSLAVPIPVGERFSPDP